MLRIMQREKRAFRIDLTIFIVQPMDLRTATAKGEILVLAAVKHAWFSIRSGIIDVSDAIGCRPGLHET